jgi:hypothetical protein
MADRLVIDVSDLAAGHYVVRSHGHVRFTKIH